MSKQWPAATITMRNVAELTPYANNSRTHSPKQIDQIAASINEFGWTMPVLIDEKGMLIAGHGRIMAAQKLGITEVPTMTAKGWTEAQKKAYVIADNQLALTSEWNEELLGVELQGLRELDFDLDLLGFDFSDLDEWLKEEEKDDLTSEEYLDFLNKFEAKKTTDDCYTPSLVYDAVKDWVVKEYGIEGKKVIRPFRPEGDYKKESYPEGSVVIDNPPFSILSEISRFYIEKGIKYFLFGPSLTLFHNIEHCAVITDSQIIYDNGAIVSTGFVTNMEEGIVRTAPELSDAIDEAVEATKDELVRSLPSYEYPNNVITSALINKIAKVDFKVERSEGYGKISSLDSQKETGKGLFGGGFLISDKKADVLGEAKKKKENEKIVWELSEEERGIVEKLGVDND